MILTSWPGRQLAEQERGRDQQDREEHEVVGHAVAHRFAEDVDGDRANRPHGCLRFDAGARRRRLPRRAARRSPRASRAPGSATPARRRRPSDRRRMRSGGGLERQLERVAAGRDLGRRGALPAPAASSSSGATSAMTSSQPRTSNASSSVSLPAAARRPPATMATRLHSASASARMCELKKTVRPWSRSSRISDADVAAAERIEPGHRLVEKDHFGIVEQRLRDADALHHPLRELAQLEPALGADADAIEQRRDARVRARRARSRTAGRSTSAALRR